RGIVENAKGRGEALMTTIAPTHPDTVGDNSQSIVLRGIPWSIYDGLSEAIGERAGVRLAYDGENLQIMTKSRFHEVYAERLGRIILAVAMARRIEHATCGEMTWKREDIHRGIEADLSYYFDAGKLAADKAARSRRSNDPADYPLPD